MKTINFIIIVFLISLGSIVNVFAIENNFNCPVGAGYGVNSNYGLGSIILNWAVAILFIILIIAGIYWFIKSANNKINRSKK